MKATVNEAGRFYTVQNRTLGTHLALRWKGQVRYTVPRDSAGQEACWNVFQPGALGMPLRAMARLPRLFGSVSCVESDQIASIREVIGEEAGLSYCRVGAAGAWSKDTILFVDKKKGEPLYIVKAGTGTAVDNLLQNEVSWLRTLRDHPSLVDNIPEPVAHRSGSDFCFIGQRAVSGKFEFKLGELQLDFLRKLQEHSLRLIPYTDSRLHQTLTARLIDLKGHLTEAWSSRLDAGMRRIREVLSAAPVLLVAAHNDFTPWNIRIQRHVACVFDWEYAADEQLPLFDPLHFVLHPLALKSRPTIEMVARMRETLQFCQQRFAKELCYETQTQSLAYLINISTLYLWGSDGEAGSHPILETYAHMIDHILPV